MQICYLHHAILWLARHLIEQIYASASLAFQMTALIRFEKVSKGAPMNAPGPEGNQLSNVVLRGANELPWPGGFQIDVKLETLLAFLQSSDFRGHLK